MITDFKNGIKVAKNNSNDGLENMCNAFAGELNIPIAYENICSVLGGIENMGQDLLKQLKLKDYSSIFNSIKL